MDFYDVINLRRSCRSYKSEEVSKSDIEEIIKSGMKAPVARGSYDNIKLVVYSGKTLELIREKLIKVLKRDPLYGAPCLISIYHKGENVDLVNLDAGCIGENLALKATELCYGNVLIYCLKPIFREVPSLTKYLSIDNFNLAFSIALGKSNENETKNKEHKIEVIYKE